MRTVTYGAACSLDGFITGPNDAMDWLHFSADVQEVTGRFWSTIDTVVMGRKTWEVAAASGAGGGGNGGTPQMHTYVFSRTLKQITAPGVDLVSSDAVPFVRDLKHGEGQGICVMGGGEFARSLFEGGVIDEVGLNIHPVLLGAGVPMFRDAARRVTLELLENRTIDGGCVLVTYRVKH